MPCPPTEALFFFASERGGNTFKGLKDIDLEDNARIMP